MEIEKGVDDDTFPKSTYIQNMLPLSNDSLLSDLLYTSKYRFYFFM